MRLPRDISGDELIAALRRHGYEVARQTGSHVILTHREDAHLHLVIPRHRSIKVGLLGAIVSAAAAQLGQDREAFSEELLGWAVPPYAFATSDTVNS